MITRQILLQRSGYWRAIAHVKKILQKCGANEEKKPAWSGNQATFCEVGQTREASPCLASPKPVSIDPPCEGRGANPKSRREARKNRAFTTREGNSSRLWLSRAVDSRGKSEAQH